ncbi:MAG: antitoxin [bacterium]|nr:antitoxin [bacterium]
MREEYDFSESIKNPYIKYLRKPITIQLGIDVIDYFNEMAEETGIPYQSLINLYLKDCLQSHRKLFFKWAS